MSATTSSSSTGPTVGSVIAEIWATLLGHRPEPNSDFFDDGGDSMVAARLTIRVNRTLRVRADTALVFENRRFDRYVNAVGALAQEPRPMPAEQPASAPAAIEWSEQLSYNKRKRLTSMARRLRAGQPQKAKNTPLVLEFHGPLDLPGLQAAVLDVINHQPALRTSFDFRSARPRWSVVDQLDSFALGHRRVGAGVAAWRARVDELLAEAIPVDRAPLVRGEVLTQDDDRHLLVLIVEHMISDGISLDILRWELLVAYGERSAGRRLDLPPIETHPQLLLAARDFDLERNASVLVDEWRTALAGLDHPPEFDLATHRPALELPRPAEHRTIDVAGPAARRILARCKEFGFSETAMALAAVYLALRTTTGSTDVPLVTASARRDTPESERMVDWFAELLIVRCRVGQDPADAPVADVIAAVQHELWAAQRRALSFTYLLQRISAVPPDATADFPWVFVSYLKPTPVPAADAHLRPNPLRIVSGTSFFHGPSIEINASEDGLEIDLSTAAGRYESGVVEQYATHLQRTLELFARRDWRAQPISGY